MEDHDQEYPSAFDLLDKLKDASGIPEQCVLALFVTITPDGDAQVFSATPPHLKDFAAIISVEIKAALSRACQEQLRHHLQ